MPIPLLAAQMIAATSAPVAIDSEAQARAMTPAQLADRILAAGHPRIDVAEVGPHGLEPPPPPGSPPQFGVTLVTQPVAAAQPGYCTRQRIEATVVDPGAHATIRLGPVTTLYRLGRPCVGGKTQFGRFEDAAAMATIRNVDRARHGPLLVDYIDRLPPRDPRPRYVDGMAALRAVDLGTISWAGAPDHAGSMTDLRRKVPAGADAVAFYAGDWSGMVQRAGNRIVHVWLKREYPAPF